MGGFGDNVNAGYLPEDVVLAARREEIAWVHSERVCENVPMQECTDAGKKRLDVIWVDKDTSVDPAHKKNRSRLCLQEYKTKKQGRMPKSLIASQLFSAMPPLESAHVLISIMMSVGWSSKGKQLKLRQHDISRAHFQGTAQMLMYVRLPAKIDKHMKKTELAGWSRACTAR